VVSSEAPWPGEAWGATLHNIRGSEHYVKNGPERRAELGALGFRWKTLA
jgi:hypothetical protein